MGVVSERRLNRKSQSEALFTGGRVRKTGCRLIAQHWVSLDTRYDAAVLPLQRRRALALLTQKIGERG